MNNRPLMQMALESIQNALFKGIDHNMYSTEMKFRKEMVDLNDKIPKEIFWDKPIAALKGYKMSNAEEFSAYLKTHKELKRDREQIINYLRKLCHDFHKSNLSEKSCIPLSVKEFCTPYIKEHYCFKEDAFYKDYIFFNDFKNLVAKYAAYNLLMEV